MIGWKIRSFEVSTIASALKEAIENTHKYLFEVYEGVYCQVCNATFGEFVKS